MTMKLYPYQEQYIQSLPPSSIMAADLGTGKTLMSLAHWERQGTGHKLLIVAPASKIRTGDWQEEAGRWFGSKYVLYEHNTTRIVKIRPNETITSTDPEAYLQELPMPEIEYISYEKLRLTDPATRRPRWWQYTGARNGGVVYDVIADECLTGETLVTTDKGLKEIADIEVGDRVMSYNHKMKKAEYKPVVRLVQRYSDDDFYLVSYTNGAIISTYNHPHYVNGEYKLVKDIKPGDYLYEQRQTNDTGSSRKTSNNQNAHQSQEIRQEPDVQLLQKNSFSRQNGRKTSTTPSSKKSKKLVLFKRMWQSLKSVSNSNSRQKNGKNNQQPGVSGQSTSNAQTKRNRQTYLDSRPITPTLDGWQRETHRTPKNVTTPAGAGAYWMVNGTTSTPETGKGLSDELQVGYRKRLVAYWNRVRRTESQQPYSQTRRPEENTKIRKVRVESVEILKQADIERLGVVRNPDYVYCLEVEDNNNFFANGILTHNCHALKNPQSKQSKALYEIKMSGGLFIGLSGTIMPNGWIDFAGYSKLFGFTKGITEFKQRHCRIVDYKGFPEIVGYFNTDELEKQLNQIAFKLSRDQANELPDRRMFGVNIKMSKSISKKYHTYKITRQNPVTGEIYDNPSRLLSVLRQTTTDARLDNLLSIVNDTADNIVVFYNYISERKAILKALAKTDKHILRYDGEKHDQLPASDAELSNTVLVAHYKSASTGLNLQWANVTVYFSPTYSYQEFEQSIGRTHRAHQQKKCLYYLFNVKGTVDKDIWSCLREKRDFSERLWAKRKDAVDTIQ